MATVAPAYLDTWAAAISAFATDPAELDTVDALRTAIREHGLLRPVWVTQDATGSMILGNGMHRVVAAYLEGTDVTFIVAATHPGTVGDVCLDVEFRLDPRNEEASADDMFDAVSSWLRSFPLSGAGWADCDGISCQGDARVYQSYFTVTAESVTEFPEALAARAALLPGEPTLTITSVAPAGL